MAGRVWERFLTKQDRAHVEAYPASQTGRGQRPAVVTVDLYRWVFGDRPERLLDAVRTWPGSCGLAAWDAIPHIQSLLDAARAARIPIFHITGMENVPGWRPNAPRSPALDDASPETAERRRRRYEIIDEVAPQLGEPILRKSAPSAFWGTPLAGLLNGMRIDTVIVVGESTSGCVRATVVDACSYRFKVLIPEQCVFDRHEAAHAMNLFDMDQKYADVVDLSDAVDYLSGVGIVS